MDSVRRQIELEDLVETYPTTNTEQLQTIYTNKYEMNELAGFPDEPLLKEQGQKFWRSQRLFARMYSAPEREECIVMDEPGTGKTCKIIHLAMTVKRNNPHLKKIYVLSGKQQINDFRRQLIFNCTSGEYITDSILEAVNESNKRKSMSQAVRKDWELMTYKQFDKRIRDSYPDDPGLIEETNQEIAEEFSDCIFVLDEYHFLRIDDTKISFPSGWEPGWVPPPPTKEDEKPKDVKERLRQYSSIFRVMHLARRSKKFVLTATPLTNSVSELPYILNTILPIHELIPARLMPDILRMSGWDPDEIVFYDDFETEEPRTLDEWVKYLNPILQGRVVFTAAPQEGGKLSYVPIPQPTISDDSQLGKILAAHRELSKNIREENGSEYTISERLRFVEMIGVQRRTYMGMSTLSDDVDIDYDIENPSSFYGIARSITTGVFPDGSHGTKGMERWVNVDQDGNYYINSSMVYPNYDEDDKTPRTLAYWLKHWLDHLSAKMFYIVMSAMYLPGKRYVASVIVFAGGAILLGLALENAIPRDENFKPIPNAPQELYFQRYRPAIAPDDDLDYPFVAPTVIKDGKHKKEIDPAKMKIDRRFQKRLRYSIIHGKMSDLEIARIFDLYNHPENIDGDYLKVIIVSRIGQTGINLMESTGVDILDDPWNPGMLYQSVMRARRTGSHDLHIARNRRRASAEQVDIDIYPQIEVNLLSAYYVDNDGKTKNTVDDKIYERSDERGRIIAAPIRALKMIALDCQLQNERNTPKDATDLTPECDYGYCKYPCYDGKYYIGQCCGEAPRESYYEEINDEDLDRSTYDVYYAEDDIVEKLKSQISEYFTKHAIATIDALSETIDKKIHRKYYVMALADMMDENYVMLDTFGWQSYLREHRGNFYLTRLSSRADPASDYTTLHYQINLIGVAQEQFSAVIDEENYRTTSRILESLESAANPYSVMQNIMRTSPILTTIGIFEQFANKDPAAFYDAVDYYRTREPDTAPLSTAIGAILEEYFNTVIFVTYEPITYISTINRLLSEDNMKEVKKTVFEGSNFEHTGNLVVLHSLYSLVKRKAGYGIARLISKAVGRIRLWKMQIGDDQKPIVEGWRDISGLAEEKSYRAIIRSMIEVREQNFVDNFSFYGKTIEEGKLHISDRRLEHKGGKATQQHLGKDCNTFNRSELAYYMFVLGIELEDAISSQPDIDHMRAYIYRQWSDPKEEKEPTMFDGHWSIQPTNRNQRPAPEDFIRYCYALALAGKSKNYMCSKLLEHFIENGRVFSQGFNPVIQYKKMAQKRGKGKK